MIEERRGVELEKKKQKLLNISGRSITIKE
jgi:hypothetical protein